MSQVFFLSDPGAAAKLFDLAGFAKIVQPKDFVALKIHFGEQGNTAYVKPDRSAPLVEKIKSLGGQPFWTDSNTLYKGSRGETISHLQTAHDHGYSLTNTGASVIIADGLEGHSHARLPVNYELLKELFVGSLIMEADALLAITHFKGHELTGFGGAIKNISMGLASRAGKQQLHADLRPVVDEKTCTACGRCLKWCPQDAISWSPNGKAAIDLTKCVGCGECVVTCRFNAIAINWNGEPDSVQKKMAEYAAGIAAHFKGKAAFINFITDISPNCDCYPHNDPPVVPDIGIAASFDPVALDQACVDLVNKTAGSDKFRDLWGVDWSVQLAHAEKIGLGSRRYELVIK